jgi:hypothetical protein
MEDAVIVSGCGHRSAPATSRVAIPEPVCGGRPERPAGAVAVLPLTPFRVVQSCSPAVADIIGARRAWTVAMISSASMPCR